ncbi:MAG: hypothetical protein R3B40_21440 [Polyangiales bacterium]
MTRKQTTPRGRTGPKKTASIEWIGGTITLPSYVADPGGEPYRPEALFWMGAEGALLGSQLTKPDELLRMASDSLASTIENTMFGEPHAPTRVRVASPELADALRAGHPGLDVVCAPTPELDDVLAAMRESLGQATGDPGAQEPSFLAWDITAEAMGAFFTAAAALYRAKPWKVVPDDQTLFAVTIERFDVRDGALSVIGQAGQSFGLILFSSLDDFEAYLDGADAMERGETPELPEHLVLSYERRAVLQPALVKEATAHGWEVATSSAYPLLMSLDEELIAGPPESEQVTMAEALALALTQVLGEKKALKKAWAGGEPFARTLTVSTAEGEVEVTLRTPYARMPLVFDASHDLLADLAALARHEHMDDGTRQALEDALMERFAAAPEAQDVEDPHACRFLMDFAANYLGHTVASLGAADLRRVVFQLFPRKVSIEPSEASWVVDTLRAFYTFLKRELGLKQADACLAVLGGDAVKKLEAALSNPGNFGMAKSMVMAGAEAGFDVQSQEGLEAFMQSMSSMPLPASFPVPGLPQPTSKTATQGKAASQEKKGKRKAARSARRKNR